MEHTTRLGILIFTHWKTYLPEMVAELTHRKELQKAILQAETRAAEILFNLLSEQKMQYQQAWEIAMQGCLLPEERKSSIASMKDPRATSK